MSTRVFQSTDHSLSDQDIIAIVTSEDVFSDDDNDDGMEQPPDITTEEAKAAVFSAVVGEAGKMQLRTQVASL
ncbi:hypothetical protein J6590_050480 [Homalodisca vitripennis]|nr:hypothetical protein J6590_050480 [Homalodisca vitripennis]